MYNNIVLISMELLYFEVNKMATDSKQIRIAVSVALQDAGEATRSIEIMKIIRDTAPSGYSIQGIFFTHGSKFDQKVLNSGFTLQRVDPPMEGEGSLGDLKPTADNFIGDKELAFQLLQGEIEALKRCRPDLIVHGFWPIVGIARRMVEPVVPALCFMPLPFEPSMFSTQLLREIPDQIRLLTYLPKSIQRKIMQRIPAALKLKLPILKQRNLIEASEKCGWPYAPLRNLFDMLKADRTIVNDLSYFYRGMTMPEGFVLTGALYSPADPHDDIGQEISGIYNKQRPDQVNLFCTMGSSAKKEFLIEAVKAIVSLPAERFHSVILVPKAVCPIEEIAPMVAGNSHILITDAFVPAKLVNAQADLTICHGGQGTIQTAIASGCPLIGFAMQPEQQINLDNAARAGAGIRIPSARWKKGTIVKAIEKMIENPAWKQSTCKLRDEMQQEDSRSKVAETVWSFITQNIIENSNR